jgi:hypothetical protein
LLLGGSGDGKTLLMKLIWSFLHSAGYSCCYFDPKSIDSGRAQKGWKSPYMPPWTKPEGIKLKHYSPVWSYEKLDNYENYLTFYSIPLEEFDTRTYWEALGMSPKAATKTDKACKMLRDKNKKVTIPRIESLLKEMLDNDEIFSQTFSTATSVLGDLDYFNITNIIDYEVLDLQKCFDNGLSVCISYSNVSPQLLTFDVGFQIRKMVNIAKKGLLKKPVVFFFGDAGFYAKELKTVKFNFAVKEITDIGNMYRSLGLNSVIEAQSLGVIDEEVAPLTR